MLIAERISKIINLFRKILSRDLFTSARSGKDNQVDSSSVQNIEERARIIYGEQRIKRQKLYEQWVIKGTWNIKRQAIPILLSISPEAYRQLNSDDILSTKGQALWLHACSCIEQRLLHVLDPQVPADQWEALPVDVYRWATVSRIEIDTELSALMEFIIGSTHSTLASTGEQSATARAQEREQILGAALAMLATYPDSCKDQHGRIEASKIHLLIQQRRAQIFTAAPSDLSAQTHTDLIEQWLSISDHLSGIKGSGRS